MTIHKEITELQILNRKTTGKPVEYPVRVLQFGGGNFLRAFCDWMFDVLNKTTDFNGSVAVVKPTERGEYSELLNQDGLFHVVLDGLKDGNLVSEVTLVESVSTIIQPYKDWNAYLALAEVPELRFIVSNTTEAGIKFSEKDQKTDNPPHEFPAKLTLWLYHRFNYFKGAADKGCILLPCELIEDNGDALQKTIIQYAEHWGLETAFITWINNCNYFCSTLVDRIVSGFPTDRKVAIEQQTGYKDDLLVAGEVYHSWVIKAAPIVQKELPFSKTDLNVLFVDDLKEYREMKVRILNGAHTSLVPVGYLAGLRTVLESMNDDLVRNHVLQVLSEEIKPTLTNFSEKEIDAFINAVIDRFKNPTLKHFLIAISLNSTSKFQARLLPAFKEYTQINGHFPKRIAFSLACLIRFYKGEFDGEHIPVNDDANVLGYFNEEWRKVTEQHQTIENLVTNVLSNSDIVGENLTTYNGLVQFVTKSINSINEVGVKECLKAL
ncbi:tagaturonate reductase [Maribacter sp. 1_MG-2023]|uniref:tagaturonate reductase n=1 Tax=Maribacter sp. 1_MG-2023 TaxID=3062677 RepID=UPI0026E4677B|nr:tagaturonate reductase [Maribacter sp. 1_MG-2023]MDO6470421.1 tagaturonate reductase [Maribacter sp. 1_MG-2023]